jgi:multidrug efflux pump subunit AcrB
VGGPTILATLTVIAALLPMAFVTGLMGPYMSPIPINASMGMLLSLAIAFVVTPWLARLWMKEGYHGGDGIAAKLAPLFSKAFRPFLEEKTGASNRRKLGLGVAILIALSVLLPVLGFVQLKMLPFDNKSEFQIVVDMPAGTPVKKRRQYCTSSDRIYKQYRKSPIIKPMRVRLHRLILMGWCANTIYVQPVS